MAPWDRSGYLGTQLVLKIMIVSCRKCEDTKKEMKNLEQGGGELKKFSQKEMTSELHPERCPGACRWGVGVRWHTFLLREKQEQRQTD